MMRFAIVCLPLVAGLIGAAPMHAAAAALKPETVDAWNAYVHATEARIAREIADDAGFLALDFRPRPESVRGRRDLAAGKIVVSEMTTRARSGTTIEVPSGAIHHWRGSVFVPGLALEDVLNNVKHAYSQHEQQEDVLESRVLSRDEDSMRVFLKLKRSHIVTVVYNTEHDIRYQRQDDGRASSTSRTTKIAEVVNAGSPGEREKPQGRDRGFLWRLNSYWRYEQVEGGVIVECESVSLSRDIPTTARLFVGRVINGVARESMERTLVNLRDRLVDHRAGAVAAAP